MRRREVIVGLGGAAAWPIAVHAQQGAVTQTRPLYPEIADTSHASEQAAAFFHSYFTAKSQHKVAEWMQHFSREQLTYIDGTSGTTVLSFADMARFLDNAMPKWPESGKSYPTRIIGNTSSALVAYTDTPELFGGEIRILAAVDFRAGKVARQLDYWGSRSYGAEALARRRPPEDKFPVDFRESTVGDNASAKIKNVAQSLNAALAGNDAAAAATLFSYDAAYEDMALRVRILGQPSIRRYLARTLAHVPYGNGATVRHVVGSDQGGGYEWVSKSGPVKRGITALELDGNGQISRLTTTWDNGLLGDADLQSLVLLSIDR